MRLSFAGVLDKMKADVVHLDLTLGGASIEELSPFDLSNLRHLERGSKTPSRFCPDLEKLLRKLSGSIGLTRWLLAKKAFPCVLRN